MISTPLHPVVWFEIPVHDLDRATHFYQSLFDLRLTRETIEGYEMATFPFEGASLGGALIKAPHLSPAPNAMTLHFDCAGRLDDMVAMAKSLGGHCVYGPKNLGRELGRVAIIIDSEGNRIGLHEEFASRPTT